jgi:DNA polymerase I
MSKPSKKPLRLLVDGDIPIYRYAVAQQFKIKWDEETVSEVVLPKELAEIAFDDFIVRTCERVQCDDFLIVLSDARDFRFSIYPEYQANRQDKAQPVWRGHLKEYVQAKYPWKSLPSCEADDTLGIIQTSTRKRFDTIIATIDKDLRQIPGKHYSWKTDDIFTITPAEAKYNFLMQTLTGDSTDGVKGIPRVGPAKASKWLEENGISWEAVMAMYEKHGLDEAYAIQQARAVKILHRSDYDLKRKEVILWEPKPQKKQS